MERTAVDTQVRLAQLKDEVPTRGMERHVSLLPSISELPFDLYSSSLTSLAPEESIQQIIYFPPQIHHGWDYVPKQALIFTSTGVVNVQASIWPDEEPVVSYVQHNSLMFMRITLLLLYGRIEIAAQRETSPVHMDMEFNTVAWYRLSVPLRKLLQASKEIPSEPEDPVFYAPAAQQAVEKLPIKFANGVKIYGLLPGEKLEDLVFQSRIWKRKYIFFREPVITNSLLLLTSNYMVVIQEDLKVSQGWIVTYIPRKNIFGMASQANGDGKSTLTIRVKKEYQSENLEILMMQDAVDSWRRVWIQHGGKWHDLTELDNPINPV